MVGRVTQGRNFGLISFTSSKTDLITLEAVK